MKFLEIQTVTGETVFLNPDQIAVVARTRSSQPETYIGMSGGQSFQIPLAAVDVLLKIHALTELSEAAEHAKS